MAVRCPYGEGSGDYAQCDYREGHAGPHSYELDGSEGRSDQGGSSPRSASIQTRTRVFFAEGRAYLDPSPIPETAPNPSLCINYGGERGEPLNNARLTVDLEELEEAIKTYKEMNRV